MVSAPVGSSWILPNLPPALQRIKDAGDRSLILILSDINMPGMSGLVLLPQARAARPDASAPFSSALRFVSASP
jgi:CheY-like chemotaxis protein